MENPDNVQNLKMLLPLIYIIPSYILYILIIFTIFISKKKKKFVAPFYQLFGISAIVYLFCSIIYFFVIRMPNTPFLTPFVKLWGERSFLLTIFQMALWYATNVAPLFHLAISFNRFTVFILKIRYEEFWTKWLAAIVFLCILFPFCLIWHIPFQGIFMQLQNESNPNSLRYLAATNKNAIPWMNNPRNAAILITITSMLSFIFNMFCVVKLLIEKYFWKNLHDKKTSKPDILLTVYTMLVFACDVLHCFHQYTILTITDVATINAMFEIQYYLFDMTDLSPAWLILLTNRALRNEILPFKIGKKVATSLFVSSHSPKMIGTFNGTTRII